jgi:hypothetical protein
MADFTLTPTWAYPEEPEFHNVITQSESMKKDYQNISTTAVQRFILEFTGLSDANFKTLYDHYNGGYGSYDLFNWLNANIPGYLKTLLGITSENLSGRWVDGSFSFKLKSHSWDAKIKFEKNN